MINKRVFIYGAILIIFAVAVCIRQNIVRSERSHEAASVNSEWERDGKPVIVREISRQDVREFAKITAVPDGDGQLSVHVPRLIQEKLRPGQPVFLNNPGDSVAGRVTEVAEDIDLNTGMFPVKTTFTDKEKKGLSSLVLYVNTGTLKDVICLPREVIVLDQGQNFVWVIEAGRAKLVPVETGERNGYGIVIEQGLKEGDRVVFQGYAGLSEGDKVNILANRMEGERL